MGITIVDDPYKANIADRYKLNPEDSGLRSLYKKIPTNMRLFVENLLGDTSTITEDDFTNDELIEMIALIEKQQGINIEDEQTLKAALSRGELNDADDDALVSYKNTRGRTSVNPYRERSGDMVDQDYSSSLTRSFNDPMYNVATTLGQYTATDIDGGYNIRDIYDFNRDERNLPTDLSKALQYIIKSPEIAGEYLSNLLGSEPRDVDIALEKILKDME